MKRVIAVIVVAIMLAGCVAEYQTKNLSGTHQASGLTTTKGVYIALPGDGTYESQTYPGSGQTVVQELAEAFSEHAVRVDMGSVVMDQADAIAAASKHGDRYVVIPAITHWEPRNTAWSGKRSRMALQIAVFDAATAQSLSSVAIEGESAQIGRAHV